MLTKHISTNTESLKPCFTAYPAQHKNKSGKLCTKYSDKWAAHPQDIFSKAANRQASYIFHITSGYGIEKLCLRQCSNNNTVLLFKHTYKKNTDWPQQKN